jgi:hypothetical protein
MGLNRQQVANIYRPLGPKLVQSGIQWSSGGSYNLAQGIDLSVPIRGFRIVFKGRLVIGTANFASVNPEGFLNLISNLNIIGTNKRQGGNVTMWNIDLATLYVIQSLFGGYRGAAFGDVNGTELPVPTTPFPSSATGGYAPTNTGTYDFRIVVDVPAHPVGAVPSVRPGFLIRNDEWKDSIQLQFTYGTQVGGAVAGAFGTGAAGTTVTFTSFGSGTGTPTIDVYSLPCIMGLDVAGLVVPGLLSRVVQPINTPLVNGGNNTTLLNLQKQPTTRVIVKSGTSTVTPAFATLSDNIITAAGITLGGNRQVRNLLDVFAHKGTVVDEYQRDPIQGYFAFDFMESDNPFSAYPGDQIGDGSLFQLVANATATGNGYGTVIQEMMLYPPDGPLYGS